MSCCGHKRHQWQQNNIQSQRQATAPKPTIEKPVAVVYQGSGSCLVKGEQTGLVYLFGENERSLEIDSRDLQQLLQQPQKFTVAKD